MDIRGLFVLDENKLSMKTTKYHTVGTVPKHNRKMEEIGKINTSNTYIWPLTFLAWNRHFNEYKVAALTSCYLSKAPLMVKWCGHACTFHVWVQCQPSHTTGKEAKAFALRILSLEYASVKANIFRIFIFFIWPLKTHKSSRLRYQ